MLRFSADTWARIGSRWATSWQLYLVGLPVSVLGHIAFVSMDSTTGVFGVTLSWSVIGYAAMGLLWWLARVTVFRNADTTPLPVAVVAAFGALSGAVRSGVSVLGMVLTGFSAWELVPVRITQGALISVFLIPLGSYLAASIAELVTQRRALHEKLVAVTAARMESELEGEQQREQISQELQTLLGDVAQRLEEVSDREPGEVRAALRAALDESIIPAQHRMRDDAPPTGSRISGLTIVRSSWTLAAAPIWIISAAWVVLITGPEVGREGVARGVALVVVSTMVVAITFFLGRWITRRAPLPTALVLVLTVLTTAVIGTVAVHPIRAAGPVLPLGQVLLAFAVLLFMVVIVNSLRNVALASRSSIEVLAAQVDAEQAELDAARRLQAQYRRDAARILHTDIQGALEGVLRSAEMPDEGEDARWILGLIQRMQPSIPHEGSVDITDGVHQLARRWSGMVQLMIEDDCHHLVSASTMNAIAECVTNAFRHGGARHVRISARPVSAELLEIVVVDYGAGLPANVRPGVGTEIIAAGAAHGWRREPDPGGGVRVVLMTDLSRPDGIAH